MCVCTNNWSSSLVVVCVGWLGESLVCVSFSVSTRYVSALYLLCCPVVIYYYRFKYFVALLPIEAAMFFGCYDVVC